MFAFKRRFKFMDHALADAVGARNSTSSAKRIWGAFKARRISFRETTKKDRPITEPLGTLKGAVVDD